MQLGIRQMFTHQASLPQLVRGSAVQDRLQVSNVLQKTGIEINEKGSTAYVFFTIFSKLNYTLFFFYEVMPPLLPVWLINLEETLNSTQIDHFYS